MKAGDIAKDLRDFTKSGTITPKQLSDYLGVSATWRVSEKYLKGLDHIGHRYFIPEVAKRLKEDCSV